MKSINSLIKWIFFVPVFALSLIIALFNGISAGSVAGALGTNQNGVAQIVTFAVLGLFAVCFITSLFDRKTSPVHMLRKNIFCGVTSVGAALAMAAHAAFDVTNIINGAVSASFMSILTIVFTGVAGVTMLYLGLNHFVGKNTNGTVALLYLSLPLWCASHLIERFLRNTATPVAASESLDLVMFVALALFFMNIAMIHSVISMKNAVKSTINYGLPAVVITLVYSITLIFSVASKETFVFLDLVPAFAYIFIALYTMGFVAELSFRAKTVDEQVILEAEEDKDTTFSDEYYSEEKNESDSAQNKSFEEDASEEVVLEEVDYDDVPDNEEKVTFFEEDDDEDFFSEENLSFDDAVAEVEAVEEETPISPYIGAIRTVEDTEEEEETQSEEAVASESNIFLEDDEDDVALDDDIDFDSDESETNVANELFKAAQKHDNKTDSKPAVAENPEEMRNKTEEKPKGPTTREAIMYDEEDFILTVQNNDTVEGAAVKDEEISAFILEDEETEDGIAAKKSYEERLDEIDRLIISIQGGEEPEKK